ncbi:GatB/YqeY domain-containing protein [bacterium]|uniref:GatB/YqeY domain-containing protein n=1 Tax=Candidatus Ventrenecus sp. TaxID=3085654 RepID=UPI001D3EFE8A|nr:GatB/YqeY domain-containing protein [bacterium]
MNLNERISEDMKGAMKTGDKFKLSVLRMLKSSLQLEKINLKKDLDDKEVMSVIKKAVKQRKDSIVEFEKYGKTEEIADLQKEIDVLKVYLPEELSEEKIKEEVEEAFQNLKPESIKDMGKVMKYLTDKIGTQADMSLVSKLVKSKF